MDAWLNGSGSNTATAAAPSKAAPQPAQLAVNKSMMGARGSSDSAIPSATSATSTDSPGSARRGTRSGKDLPAPPKYAAPPPPQHQAPTPPGVQSASLGRRGSEPPKPHQVPTKSASSPLVPRNHLPTPNMPAPTPDDSPSSTFATEQSVESDDDASSSFVIATPSQAPRKVLNPAKSTLHRPPATHRHGRNAGAPLNQNRQAKEQKQMQKQMMKKEVIKVQMRIMRELQTKFQKQLDLQSSKHKKEVAAMQQTEQMVIEKQRRSQEKKDTNVCGGGGGVERDKRYETSL
jgi:hypothetical protein